MGGSVGAFLEANVPFVCLFFPPLLAAAVAVAAAAAAATAGASQRLGGSRRGARQNLGHTKADDRGGASLIKLDEFGDEVDRQQRVCLAARTDELSNLHNSPV